MLYQAYQALADALAPLRFVARTATALMTGPDGAGGWPSSTWRRTVAAYELAGFAGLTHRRPAFGISSVESGGRRVEVLEEAVQHRPFGTLLRFRKQVDVEEPRVLLVAPLSGHFATLLRGTVRTLLRDHDVYVTDWHNARDVPLSDGRFDFNEFIDYLVGFFEVLGPGVHLVAVCQPCPAALAAVAVMAQAQHPCRPRSMTLMAGPVDTRVNPTEVNRLAQSHSIDWFERNLIASVPWRYPGAGRSVYPGFLQIAAFMGMNLERHAESFAKLYNHVVAGDSTKAAEIRAFYDEYLSMMDLPAEFYLQTVREIFQEHALPLGRLEYRGARVEPGAIHRTALLTVEGEKDDICAIGQTLAAHDLCTGIRPYRKQHYVQTGAGHYGVFNGQRWEQQTYPLLRDFIHVNDD